MKHANFQSGKAMPIVIILIVVIGAIAGFTLVDRPDDAVNEETAQIEAMQDMAMQDAVDSDAMMQDNDMQAEVMQDTMKAQEEEEVMQDVMEAAAEDVMEDVVIMQDDAPTASFTPTGTVLAGSTTPMIDFNQADFEAAVAAGKDIALVFHATWCPTCKKEFSDSITPAFSQIDNPNVVAFYVNYKDSADDNFEQDLARKYGVAYQHAKILLKGGTEVVFNQQANWSTQQYITNLTNFSA